MIKHYFTLSNADKESGGERFPSTPYYLENFFYDISIKSRSPIWEIKVCFYDANNVKDFAKDEFLMTIGRNENNLYFSQFNKIIESIKKSEADEGIKFLIRQKDDEILIYFKDRLVNAITLHTSRSAFHFYSSRPLFDTQTHMEVCIFEKTEKSIDPGSIHGFHVGKMEFCHADLFEHDIISESGLVILPCATDGSISSVVAAGIEEMNFPHPSQFQAGELQVLEMRGADKKFYIGYGYSVEDNKSSLAIIESLCKNIIQINHSPILGMATNSDLKIAIPLFGTGAGKLLPTDVAQIFDKYFSQTGSFKIIVAVKDRNTFSDLWQYFSSRVSAISENRHKPRPNAVRKLEEKLGLQLGADDYSLDWDLCLNGLYFNGYRLSNLDVLRDYPTLQELSFKDCDVIDYSPLMHLHNLKTLSIINTEGVDFSFLRKLKNLVSLDLSFNSLRSIEFLTELTTLKYLRLSNNLISELPRLRNLPNLSQMDLRNNNIVSIEHLVGLKHLKNLYLSDNKIENINPIAELFELEHLEIHNNRIDDLQPLSSLEKLYTLRIENNPVIYEAGLILEAGDNQNSVVKGFLQRQAESNKVEFNLPVKVLLLGNHAAGKSSLLEYIINGRISSQKDSTHIISIKRYPDNSQNIPDMIFFDFGGQDYYHGVYRAFLSAGAIYLILWNSKTNVNAQREDSNQLLTQDFTVDYWLCQKKYLENEKFDCSADEALLVQSYADMDERQISSQDQLGFNIKNDFFISLASKDADYTSGSDTLDTLGLKYLKQTIIALAEQKRIYRREPDWYLDFIYFIISQNEHSDHEPVNVADYLLPHYKLKSPDKLGQLLNDLTQLHRHGLVLFYEDMPDIVWLNPSAVARYIHEEVLRREDLKHKRGMVHHSCFKGISEKMIQLLCLQKIIFKYDNGSEPQYIIPNFLKLVCDDKTDYDLFTFGLANPAFVLKFERFLPFGIINQLICFFGKQSTHCKFWRDQLLFTFQQKVKVLININFARLEIRVHCAYIDKIANTDKNEIVGYLFFAILNAYWDMKHIFDFNEYVYCRKGPIKLEDYSPDQEISHKISSYDNLMNNPNCRPLDLHISLDGKYFINYKQLCGESTGTEIPVKLLGDDQELQYANFPVPIYNFQPFTNKKLTRRKKVVISYSKKDLTMVNTFRDHLIALYQDELIDHPWYCTELIAGQKWNPKIEKEFNEADIIFFMVSEKLMATQYVIDNEIKNAIDKYNKGDNISIIPIILKPYHWTRKGNYNLGNFTALPYIGKPIKEFPNEDQAWEYICDAVRILIEHGDEALEKSDYFTPRMKKIQEDIMNNRF